MGLSAEAQHVVNSLESHIGALKALVKSDELMASLALNTAQQHLSNAIHALENFFKHRDLGGGVQTAQAEVTAAVVNAMNAAPLADTPAAVNEAIDTVTT